AVRRGRSLPSYPLLHLLDKVEHRRADHRIVGVGDAAEGEVRLIGERVAPALLRPHAVDHAFAVFAQERARGRPGAVVAFVLVPFEVGGDKLGWCDAQVAGSISHCFPSSQNPYRTHSPGVAFTTVAIVVASMSLKQRIQMMMRSTPGCNRATPFLKHFAHKQSEVSSPLSNGNRIHFRAVPLMIWRQVMTAGAWHPSPHVICWLMFLFLIL